MENIDIKNKNEQIRIFLESIVKSDFYLRTSGANPDQKNGFSSVYYGKDEYKNVQDPYPNYQSTLEDFFFKLSIEPEEFKSYSEIIFFSSEGIFYQAQAPSTLDDIDESPENSYDLQTAKYHCIHSSPPRPGNDLAFALKMDDPKDIKKLEALIKENPLVIRDLTNELVKNRLRYVKKFWENYPQNQDEFNKKRQEQKITFDNENKLFNKGELSEPPVAKYDYGISSKPPYEFWDKLGVSKMQVTYLNESVVDYVPSEKAKQSL